MRVRWVMRIKPPLPTSTLENSRRLRKEMTDAEHKLWRFLRAGRLEGLKFRRQHPIPPYIADFCCIEEKLIVELDGSQHTESTDAPRTSMLQSQGWKVLRFWDHDVLSATEAVVEAIWNTTCKPYHHPNPPQPCTPFGRRWERGSAENRARRCATISRYGFATTFATDQRNGQVHEAVATATQVLRKAALCPVNGSSWRQRSRALKIQ